MTHHIAFLDVWGNDGLDFTKKGTSTHFIVAALILPKDTAGQAGAILKSVLIDHLKNRTVKSGRKDDDYVWRWPILEDMVTAPFQIFALVVDKRQVFGEGLRYKGSFYKFMHGLADRELFRIFPDLEMVANPFGTDSFMEGFIQYVHQNHISNLFNESSFGFVKDQNDVIIQSAGFVAGTLARCYDETIMSDQRQQYLELLHPKILTLKFWPDILGAGQIRTDRQDPGYNVDLAELSINLANDFLQRKAPGLAPHVIDQVTCLSYLLFHFRHISSARYISSFEIMEHIKVRRSKNVTLHYFQTKVIAPLRDAGVLIASSSRGYKLPASEADLYDFVNHSNAIIEPMLSRVKKFRDQIRLATNGTLDVLDKEEYKLIRKVVE